MEQALAASVAGQVELHSCIQDAIKKKTSVIETFPSLLEHWNNELMKNVNRNVLSLDNKKDKDSPEIETEIDDNSEDHLFEDAAQWAKGQKKDFI